MDKKLKCIVCGTVTGAFLFINANPICEECFKHIKENPHIIEIQFPIGLTGQNSNLGIEMIEITGTASSSSSSSSSISSSTTILPSELV